ncbi:MAG: efflux RND transporter periplasmic adaptor subunit [Aureliella sp.]
MSSTPSQETVEQTKQQIRGLINEIAELSRSEHEADEFYPAVLKRIVEALAAVGGAVWLIDEAGALRLKYQIKVNQNLLQADNEDAMRHGRLLSRLYSRAQSEIVPAGAFIGEDQSEGNPTQFLLVIAPLSSGKRSVGLIEIFQRPDSAPNIQRGYLRFLEQMAGLIGEWLKGHTLKQVSDRQQLWQQADHFARLVHDNLELRDTAYTIANEGRQVIECDRVSVAIKKGGHCKVIAISGQDTIENRSNIVTALNKLASRVVAAGDPLWYDGSVEDLPPQLEEAIEEYVDLSHGRTIAVLPIRRPEKVVEGDVSSKEHVQREDLSSREIIGALVIEQIESQLPADLLRSRVDLVYEHTARALANSLTHNNLFLMPLWRTLGRATWFFRGSALPKTLAVLTLVAVALLLMLLVQINLDLEANGTLQPIEQKQVFAHVDGEVEAVFVDHGSVVKAGDPLVQLRNRDLEVEITSLQGQLQETYTQIATLGSQVQAISDRIERIRLHAQMSEAVVRRDALQEQLNLQLDKKRQLRRVSPIDGVVMTWDLEKNLRLRPVVTGQVLVTVANPNSDWELELLMPEKRMKYLDEAMRTADGQPLKVEYIMVTDPSITHTGTLDSTAVHGRAELDPEEGAIVKLRVRPDNVDEISKRPGAEVKADVVCGKRSAAFVWFHEVAEWIWANVIF